MKSLKYYVAVLCIGFLSTTYSAGYADAYFYKAKPGKLAEAAELMRDCLLYTSPSPRDKRQSRMPSSA